MRQRGRIDAARLARLRHHAAGLVRGRVHAARLAGDREHAAQLGMTGVDEARQPAGDLVVARGERPDLDRTAAVAGLDVDRELVGLDEAARHQHARGRAHARGQAMQLGLVVGVEGRGDDLTVDPDHARGGRPLVHQADQDPALLEQAALHLRLELLLAVERRVELASHQAQLVLVEVADPAAAVPGGDRLRHVADLRQSAEHVALQATRQKAQRQQRGRHHHAEQHGALDRRARGLIVGLLERLGLARDVVVELGLEQQQRLLGPAAIVLGRLERVLVDARQQLGADLAVLLEVGAHGRERRAVLVVDIGLADVVRAGERGLECTLGVVERRPGGRLQQREQRLRVLALELFDHRDRLRQATDVALEHLLRVAGDAL